MTATIRQTENNYITVPYTKEIQLEYSKTFDCGNDALTLFLKCSAEIFLNLKVSLHTLKLFPG